MQKFVRLKTSITCDYKPGEFFFSHLKNCGNVRVLEEKIARTFAALLQGQRATHQRVDLRTQATQQVFKGGQQTKAAHDAAWLNLSKRETLFSLTVLLIRQQEAQRYMEENIIAGEILTQYVSL